MTAGNDGSDAAAGPSDGPLSGVRIVDFTENMSGPLATMMLGDQGADVIKVEAPSGDTLRGVGTNTGGLSAFFLNLNRSKRFVGLDLKTAPAAEIVGALVDRADVVIHNFRPAAAAKLGIDAATLCTGRPKLIHGTVIGYGTVGPYGGRPAYDHVLQALAGYSALQQVSDEPPSLVRQGVIDKIASFHVAQAITAALYERTRTGRGRSIEICMLDVAIAALWPDGMMNHTIVEPEHVFGPVSRTFRVTPTADGYVSLAAVTPRQQERFLEAVGLPESKRTTGEILRKAAAVIATLSTQEVIDLLNRYDVPVAPVVGLDELHNHPQIRANETVDEFVHPHVGPVRQANPAVRFTPTRAGELPAAGPVGEHNHEVLAELGYDERTIGELVESGVLVSGPPPVRA